MKRTDRPEAVHEVRKEIKKMRAIFRLTRGGLSEKDYRKVTKAMRLAAKPLAATRDARVTKKALESVAGRNAPQFPNIHSALKTFFDHETRSFQDNDFGGVAKYILRKVCTRLEDLKFKRTGWAEIRDRLKKSYVCGQSACQLATQKPTPGHLHKWRKQIKNLWYQLDFLCPNWPSKTKEMLAGLKKLGEQLGNDHDLILLEQFSKEKCGQGKETAGLHQLIDSKRKHHGAGIRQLGARIYANPPEAVCTQWELDWKTWRNGHNHKPH